MPDPSSTQTLLLGHSPDPDDAFMFYGLAEGLVDPGRWRFEHVLQDIQTLNERALRGELHITAISIHAYPYVVDKYALLSSGASMGDGYGPMVVAREPMIWRDLRGRRIAVPGTMTSAFLALNLLLGKGNFEHEVVMFDRILEHVAAGKADAGLIIHEGQLTYQNHKLYCVVDLGLWWQRQTGLPLPLGGNVIRRDLGIEAMREISGILRRSIRYSLDHRAEAVAHALAYARDMGTELADKFVGMYVNHYTLDYGPDGREAVREFLACGIQADLIPDPGQIEFV
ncbi:MAG TPA: MqnA/MqnD/SBP family protein [Phycisphaerae bacterium]|nr:MqnA/MqnD/SBP family protein [Phycisphaerae bacterium]